MNHTTATTTATTTAIVSQPVTTGTHSDPSPTMKLRDRGVSAISFGEMPNPLVRMAENSINAIGVRLGFDDKWRALVQIVDDVSDIPYKPSGDDFLRGLEGVAVKHKHRFQALRELTNEVRIAIAQSKTLTRAQAFLDLFNLLIALETPSTGDPHVELISNFDASKSIREQLETMLTSTESASAPFWKHTTDD